MTLVSLICSFFPKDSWFCCICFFYFLIVWGLGDLSMTENTARYWSTNIYCQVCHSFISLFHSISWLLLLHEFTGGAWSLPPLSLGKAWPLPQYNLGMVTSPSSQLNLKIISYLILYNIFLKFFPMFSPLFSYNFVSSNIRQCYLEAFWHAAQANM